MSPGSQFRKRMRVSLEKVSPGACRLWHGGTAGGRRVNEISTFPGEGRVEVLTPNATVEQADNSRQGVKHPFVTGVLRATNPDLFGLSLPRSGFVPRGGCWMRRDHKGVGYNSTQRSW